MDDELSESQWLTLWNQRGDAVRRALTNRGAESDDNVLSFRWKNFVLPGACAWRFASVLTPGDQMTISLGVSQPTGTEESPPRWEFAVCTKAPASWPPQLLFDLVTHWLDQRPILCSGMCLPLTFFLNPSRELCAGLASADTLPTVVGSIRALILWEMLPEFRFRTDAGLFGLLIAVPITHDELDEAKRHSPAHVLLLLKQLGMLPYADPMRSSAFKLPAAAPLWTEITKLPDEAVEQEMASMRLPRQ